MAHSLVVKEEVLRLLGEGYTVKQVHYKTQVPKRTIRHWRNNTTLTINPDEQIIAENIKLAKAKQKLQDTNRIERKSFREDARIENSICAINEELIKVLQTHKFSTQNTPVVKTKKGNVAIIQLSDLHLNEIVSLHSNQYNIEIASKRLHKFACECLELVKAKQCKEVVILSSADLINSDRRLDESLSMATSRSHAMFIAVDILQQFIKFFAKEYKVTVGGVCGNESRLGTANDNGVGYIDLVASDNFDWMIIRTLELLFKDTNVNFIRNIDPLELVVSINNKNVLVVHGHGSVSKTNNSKIEAETQKLIARYMSVHGIEIHYVLLGHIHSALLSDNYGRSSSTVGNNSYSEKSLNLNGKASQNIYIVSELGDIHGYKIDLQNYEGYEGFEYDTSLTMGENKSRKPNTIIQMITV